MNTDGTRSALPKGVDWTPVEEALAHLERTLEPMTPVIERPIGEAYDAFLCAAVAAPRDNPPTANAAVDGYAYRNGPSPRRRLVADRAAPGEPFGAMLEPDAAARILTGASLPRGADTVAMQEDAVVAADGTCVDLPNQRTGANVRRAGEDVRAGTELLNAGHRLRAQDVAVLAATGVARVAVRGTLRVGVLSTGNEIVSAGAAPVADSPHAIFDANGPMLRSLFARWGFVAVDLGHVGDDRAALRVRLDRAAEEADVIVTTGGASASEADVVSSLLNAEGAMALWRVAMKPGRPLGLGAWRGRPLFALPGNPVAAFVCAHVLLAPSLARCAGGAFARAQPILAPAAFAKVKRPGRREYLRARRNGSGAVEIFRSEGSGLVSGLVWATGLVELAEPALTVDPGDPVAFTPWEAFRP